MGPTISKEMVGFWLLCWAAEWLKTAKNDKIVLMINLGIFYSNLATVGLIIFLGFILGKKRWIVEHTNRQLTEILLSIAMPAALFMTFPSKFDYN